MKKQCTLTKLTYSAEKITNIFCLSGRNTYGNKAAAYVNRQHNYRKSAFTLAEVLITLGIIGVVAALTIPTLVQHYQEKAAAARLKKVHSTLQQAFISAQYEKGKPENWFAGTDVGANSKAFAEALKPYLKVQKDCGFNTGCWQQGNLKSLNNMDYVDYDRNENEYKMILADGTALIFYWEWDTDVVSAIGNVKVDIDGLAGKHTWGIDTFLFLLTNNGIIPVGRSNAENDADASYGIYDKFSEYCNLSKPSSSNGIACTAWVIYNENMDYLHCNDLSWGGKTKCK